MGRNHSNARPRTATRPLNLEVLEQSPPAKPRKSGHAVGRMERTAAKTTPSRIEARLYVALRALEEHLDEIERSLGKAKLVGEHADALSHALRRTRAAASVAKAQVDNATRDQGTHDALKATLGELRSYASALEAALVTFTSASRLISSGADVTGFVASDASNLAAALAGSGASQVLLAAAAVRAEISVSGAPAAA